MIFRFQNPLFLIFLAVWLLMIYRWYSRRQRQVFIFSSLREIGNVPCSLASRLKPFVYGLIWLGGILLILALARPQKGREEFRVRTDGISIAMCLDRSGSMQAMDFVIDRHQVNRLEVVKKVFRDFILGSKGFAGRQNDLVSLIAFGGYVDSICPLTLDHQSLAEMLTMIECPKPPMDRNGRPIDSPVLEQESATAIGDALLTAVNRLKESKSKSKVIVLLSDGVQNTGIVTAEEAAKIAKEFGIKVYTIGIGTNGPVPFPSYTQDGQVVYTREILELDEKTLRAIAKETDGKYYHVDDTDALKNVCAEIDQLEKSSIESRSFTKYNELYKYFLLPGLGFLCLGLCLVFTRFRRIP